jgi:hypothetical protein
MVGFFKNSAEVGKTLINKKDNLHKVIINKESLAIRDIVKYRVLLIGESTRIKNRLNVAIFNQYMDVSALFPDLFSKCALSFFARYPDPEKLKGEDLDSLAAFLKSNSRGRHGKEKAVDILSFVNTGIAPDILTVARSFIIKKHIERLISIQEELKEISDMLSRLVLKSPYGTLVSVPGIDFVTAAKIISQVIDISRFSSSSKLAKFIGVAPVEKSSGRKKRYQKSKQTWEKISLLFYFLYSPKPHKQDQGRKGQ